MAEYLEETCNGSGMLAFRKHGEIVSADFVGCPGCRDCEDAELFYCDEVEEGAFGCSTEP